MTRRRHTTAATVETPGSHDIRVRGRTEVITFSSDTDTAADEITTAPTNEHSFEQDQHSICTRPNHAESASMTASWSFSPDHRPSDPSGSPPPYTATLARAEAQNPEICHVADCALSQEVTYTPRLWCVALSCSFSLATSVALHPTVAVWVSWAKAYNYPRCVRPRHQLARPCSRAYMPGRGRIEGTVLRTQKKRLVARRQSRGASRERADGKEVPSPMARSR